MDESHKMTHEHLQVTQMNGKGAVCRKINSLAETTQAFMNQFDTVNLTENKH